MKKTMFGLCKKCYKIKKYDNIEIEKKSVENLRLYNCENCIINEIETLQI